MAIDKKLLQKFNTNPYSLTRSEVEQLQKSLGFVKGSKDVSNRLDGLMGNQTIRAVQRYVGTKDDGY